MVGSRHLVVCVMLAACGRLQLRNDTMTLFSTGADRTRMGIVGGGYDKGDGAGRFTTDFGGDVNGGNIDVSWGTRCVVAAIPR